MRLDFAAHRGRRLNFHAPNGYLVLVAPGRVTQPLQPTFASLQDCLFRLQRTERPQQAQRRLISICQSDSIIQTTAGDIDLSTGQIGPVCRPGLVGWWFGGHFLHRGHCCKSENMTACSLRLSKR